MWSGAGMSLAAPTCLPAGPALTRRVFDSLFEPEALAIVMGYHRALGWSSSLLCNIEDAAALPSVRLPRLETALGVAVRTHSDRALEILADLRDARPELPARRLRRASSAAAGHHITTNFDSCIEQASAPHVPGAVVADRLVHLHGSFAEDRSGVSLGATLGRIQGGLPQQVAARLASTLEVGKLLLIAGYSGSDFFDVDVTVAQLKPGTLKRWRSCGSGTGSMAGTSLSSHDPPALAARGRRSLNICAGQARRSTHLRANQRILHPA